MIPLRGTHSWFTLTQRRPMRQGVFGFIDRARRLERTFKLVIALATVGSVVFFLTALSPGRYLSGWVAARTRELARQAVGLPPDRGEIDAGWKRKRVFDIGQSHGSLKSTFAEYPPKAQRLLEYAGLDPDHALVRWGNFDRTVLLPSTVFEPDQTGRSYRFRPNTRSIWVRNFPTKGPVKTSFQALDRPELAALVKQTSAQIVDGSTQTTNSWGLRGPEPAIRAAWRGIVLGDSYMQGLFVGDRETPVECLKRDLTLRLGDTVEILNTGHLGYSPEQYYYSLIEFATRFPPRFVVVSVFANDFGDHEEALAGRGDWQEASYWLGLIRDFCMSNNLECLVVPAPWVNQVEGPQMSGNYPGKIANLLETTGPSYLDPIADFANAQLEIINNSRRLGLASPGNPLFNGRLGDGHFSARGCEIWAAAVGRRLALLIERRDLASARYSASRTSEPPGLQPKTSTADQAATPRSP